MQNACIIGWFFFPHLFVFSGFPSLSFLHLLNWPYFNPGGLGFFLLLLFLFSPLIGCREGEQPGKSLREGPQLLTRVKPLHWKKLFSMFCFTLLILQINLSLSGVFSPMKRVIEREVRFYNRGFKM